MKTPEEISKLWLLAFNEHQLEALLSLYDENARHFSPKLKKSRPETGGFIQGKAQLREWWADAFARIPSLQYVAQTITANEQRVFMEYLRKADGDEDLMVAEVLEIEHDCIVYSRVYHG
jgi:ketosteroid isomerase-like protein